MNYSKSRQESIVNPKSVPYFSDGEDDEDNAETFHDKLTDIKFALSNSRNLVDTMTDVPLDQSMVDQDSVKDTKVSANLKTTQVNRVLQTKNENKYESDMNKFIQESTNYKPLKNKNKNENQIYTDIKFRTTEEDE